MKCLCLFVVTEKICLVASHVSGNFCSVFFIKPNKDSYNYSFVFTTENRSGIGSYGHLCVFTPTGQKLIPKADMTRDNSW